MGAGTYVMLKSGDDCSGTSAAPGTSRSGDGSATPASYTFASDAVGAAVGTFRVCWCGTDCGSDATADDPVKYNVNVGDLTLLGR